MTPFFTSRIIEWFEKEARDLPWRKTSDPYKIWISEVMLQQTTVATVIPYYERFLKRFPNVDALARSSEDSVLKAWQGLGYYRRAKNLRLGAKFIVANFGGDFPKTIDELLQIPGIGRYSAGAILSIAHRIPAAALDGNLIRVYARHEGIRAPVDDSRVIKQLWKIAESNLPKERSHSREFTEGMMELGALLCTPKNPKCLECPVARTCVAKSKKWVNEIPLKSKKTMRKKLKELVVWSEKKGKVAFLPKGSDPKFPDFLRLPFENLVDLKAVKYIDRFKYSVTNRDFQVYLVRKSPKQKVLQWLSYKEIESSLLPTIDRKIVEKMRLASSR